MKRTPAEGAFTRIEFCANTWECPEIRSTYGSRAKARRAAGEEVSGRKKHRQRRSRIISSESSRDDVAFTGVSNSVRWNHGPVTVVCVSTIDEADRPNGASGRIRGVHRRTQRFARTSPPPGQFRKIDSEAYRPAYHTRKRRCLCIPFRFSARPSVLRRTSAVFIYNGAGRELKRKKKRVVPLAGFVVRGEMLVS